MRAFWGRLVVLPSRSYSQWWMNKRRLFAGVFIRQFCNMYSCNENLHDRLLITFYKRVELLRTELGSVWGALTNSCVSPCSAYNYHTSTNISEMWNKNCKGSEESDDLLETINAIIVYAVIQQAVKLRNQRHQSKQINGDAMRFKQVSSGAAIKLNHKPHWQLITKLQHCYSDNCLTFY